MPAQSTVIAYETLRSIDSATFSGAYQAVGGPTTHPIRLYKVVNNSTELVLVSTNGVTDMDVVPPSSFVLYDVGTNRGNPSPELDLPQHTQFYIKGSAGTGLVYIVVIYANTPGW